MILKYIIAFFFFYRYRIYLSFIFILTTMNLVNLREISHLAGVIADMPIIFLKSKASQCDGYTIMLITVAFQSNTTLYYLFRLLDIPKLISDHYTSKRTTVTGINLVCDDRDPVVHNCQKLLYSI